jgi:Rod binding domain-containing protein
MTIAPVQSQSAADAQNVTPENLLANKHLTEDQKIAEASRQFEKIMLQQILSETQKPVITSEFTDNSTAAGIYQDYITETLADSMSKAGTLGFAKVFVEQLTHHQNGKPVGSVTPSPAAEAINATGNTNTPTPHPAMNLTPFTAKNLTTHPATRHE